MTKMIIFALQYWFVFQMVRAFKIRPSKSLNFGCIWILGVSYPDGYCSFKIYKKFKIFAYSSKLVINFVAKIA